MAKHNRPEDGTDVIENRNVRHERWSDCFGRLEKVGIKVLRAVRKKHHERHEQHEVKEKLPMGAGAAENLFHFWGAALGPRFGFAYFGPDVKRQQGWRPADPEHRSPAPIR